MPKRSSKHAILDQRNVVPTGGLDLSVPANALADNALSRAFNWWHEPERGLCVRQGLAREDVEVFAYPVLALHPYVDAVGTLHLLAVSEGKIWRRTGATWTLVKALTSTTVVPSFLDFNGVCVVADEGDTGLWYYNGVADSTAYISGSPANPRALTTIGNRIVCASASQVDLVYFSGPEDYADWATADPGAALVIPAGFGDGADVVGFAVIYTILIIAKVKKDDDGNMTSRALYYIQTSGTPDQWSGDRLSASNTALCPHSIASVGQTAYMIDDNGFKAVAPTPNGQYGDVGVDPLIGLRINRLIAAAVQNADYCAVQYVHSLAQLWVLVRSGSSVRMVVWHPVVGYFTQLDFGTFRPRAFCEVGGVVYIAGDDGVLFRFSNKGTDELADGVESNIAASLRTKTFEGLGGDLIMKRCKIVTEPIRPATIIIESFIPETNTSVTFGTLTTSSGNAAQPLYDALDLLADADYKLGDVQAQSKPVFSGNVRASGIAVQIRVLGGRVVFNSLTAEFAVVGR
jgi:hypothetical protein